MTVLIWDQRPQQFISLPNICVFFWQKLLHYLVNMSATTASVCLNLASAPTSLPVCQSLSPCCLFFTVSLRCHFILLSPSLSCPCCLLPFSVLLFFYLTFHLTISLWVMLPPRQCFGGVSSADTVSAMSISIPLPSACWSLWISLDLWLWAFFYCNLLFWHIFCYCSYISLHLIFTLKDLAIGNDELHICQNVEDILSSEVLLPLKCLFQNFSANGQHFCFELCQVGSFAKGYDHNAHSGQSIRNHVGNQMETNSWMLWSRDSCFLFESSLPTIVFNEGHIGKICAVPNSQNAICLSLGSCLDVI